MKMVKDMTGQLAMRSRDHIFPISAEGRSRKSVVFEDHWRLMQERSPGSVPHRSDLRPHEITALLPNLIIMDIGERKQLNIRLAGTAITTKLGVEITHLDYLDFLSPETRERAWESVQAMSAYCCGLWQTMKVHYHGGASILIEGTIFPIIGMDGMIQLVGCIEHVKTQLPTKLNMQALEIETAVEYEFIDTGHGVPEPVMF